MTALLLLTLLALGGPGPTLVVMGDGLVVGAEKAPPNAGSWSNALADCLEERGTGVELINQGMPRETAVTALPRAARIQRFEPTIVAIGVGAQEAAAGVATDKFSAQLGALLRALREPRNPRVLLVDVLAPPGSPERDLQVTAYDLVLTQLAAKTEGVEHVDLWSRWPREGAARAALSGPSGGLSDRGHARVAAAVCEAVVAVSKR